MPPKTKQTKIETSPVEKVEDIVKPKSKTVKKTNKTETEIKLNNDVKVETVELNKVEDVVKPKAKTAKKKTETIEVKTPEVKVETVEVKPVEVDVKVETLEVKPKGKTAKKKTETVEVKPVEVDVKVETLEVKPKGKTAKKKTETVEVKTTEVKLEVDNNLTYDESFDKSLNKDDDLKNEDGLLKDLENLKKSIKEVESSSMNKLDKSNKLKDLHKEEEEYELKLSIIKDIKTSAEISKELNIFNQKKESLELKLKNLIKSLSEKLDKLNNNDKTNNVFSLETKDTKVKGNPILLNKNLNDDSDSETGTSDDDKPPVLNIKSSQLIKTTNSSKILQLDNDSEDEDSN